MAFLDKAKRAWKERKYERRVNKLFDGAARANRRKGADRRKP